MTSTLRVTSVPISKQTETQVNGSHSERNLLSYAKLSRLQEMLRAVHTDLAQRQLSYREAAAELSGMLGFKVTDSNLRKAIEITGIPCWVRRSQHPHSNDSSRAGKKISALRHSVITPAVVSGMDVLHAMIVHLYQELGVPVPHTEVVSGALRKLCRDILEESRQSQSGRRS